MLSRRKMPSTKTILSTAASLAASAMLIRTIANDFIPEEARNYFYDNLNTVVRHFSSQLTIIIEEFEGLTRNEVFEAANAYLGTKLDPTVKRFRVSKDEKEKNLSLTVDRNEEVTDVFEGIELKWSLTCQTVESSRNVSRFVEGQPAVFRSEVRYFQLTFHKNHKDKVLDSYLPYIIQASKAFKELNKAIKLHTAEYKGWSDNALPLDHPMTFKNLAMDSRLKEELVDDLERFRMGKDYYRKIGKAWKRGYLLYGPPGTGKSSLIAAMANHLSYDIYDLDLKEMNSNSHLRILLLSMPNKSILMIEDIDCGRKLQNRESESESESEGQNGRVTLSGLLNFVDGIWSCCAEERIIVFTTNYKDRLDPALLRPGRMDMHVHMSYCTFSTFTQLAYNYLGISYHQLFEEVQQLIDEVEVTPAEVAGELMKNLDPQVSLEGLIDFLRRKKSDELKKNEIEHDGKCVAKDDDNVENVSEVA